MRRLQSRSAGGQSQGVCRKHGVARAGDVHGLIASVNRDVQRLLSGLEKGHAVAPTRHQQRFQFQCFTSGFATAFQFLQIAPNRSVVQSFHLRLVGSRRRNPCVLVAIQLVARVERHGNLAFRPARGAADFLGSGHAKSIIRNGQGIGAANFRREQLRQFFARRCAERFPRLVIHAKNLLANRVRPARQEARFRGSGPALHADNAEDVNFLLPEGGDKAIARCVISNGGDRRNFCAKCRKVVRRVSAATRHNLRLAMLQDQHGGFAGDARDVAELKRVRHKIAENDHLLPCEALHDVRECH